ncbi:hypothetical protein OE88DRAFT_1651696 [Heliocybe sulcata]|uniref:Cytochrome c oxidase assembly factor 3 n=1 Tax=Heliocybe sulcata TaxID=5364 RepID=A0A5C3NP23_9AGAM|nr:hypothetical protein OE88DRAFT_1651696 [Heliocybe sulcata]
MSASSPYVNRKAAERSYRPKGYGMSPGLKRARAPYRTRNALTGIIIGAFATGIWWYSMRAVDQDALDDVDEQAKALAEERALNAPRTSEKAMNAQETSVVAATASDPTPVLVPPALALSPAPRGLIGRYLDSRFPRLLDPRTKTFVWGAPPVDRVGRIRDPRL